MEKGTFPNEVWYEIFKRIDIQSLMKLRLVCHQFYDLIEHLLNKSPEWKVFNLKTILDECLEMTMQRAYPYVPVTHWWNIDDPVLWRGTYLSYKKWQKVLVNPHTKDNIVPNSNLGDILCICTFDKYIAIAFDSGLIANYTIDNISQPFYLADHGARVIQVEFWYSNGEVLVVSVGDDCALKFWNVHYKIEIATNGFFANSISSGECRHFCIGNMGGILTSYERVGKHISPGPTLNLELRDGQQLIGHAVNGKYMKAMVWVKSSTLPMVNERVIEGGKLTEFVVIRECACIEWPENFGSSFQRLIMPTNRNFFEISRIFSGISLSRIVCDTFYYSNSWPEYNLGQHFGCNIISIALHAQILMFGLEDGSIHLLHIPRHMYLRDLEENIEDSKKIEVDTEPIVDLTVLEVDKKPCIVAVTKQKVHLINFF